MTNVLATNILSPLGYTTPDNIQAILQGKSQLRLYTGQWGLKEPFVASLFSPTQRQQLLIPGYSMSESIAIQSITRALQAIPNPLEPSSTILILSTTKGNIEHLQQDIQAPANAVSPSSAATNIAHYFGLTTTPIVVCNACISGVNAQILAMRLLQSQKYRTAIVCGAETLGPFIVSGFQSLKTVSCAPCRPFDMERNGLNLGECAATIVFGSTGRWAITSGAIRNDAMHITNPSPHGEGCVQAINAVLPHGGKSRLAAINVHGTATLFNDQMESKAIERTRLSDIPAFSLKGYLGHTMGANGVAETILTMEALDKGIIPATRGFAELGVSGKLSLSSKARKTTGNEFLKIISGFGGNNAAIRYTRRPSEESKVTPPTPNLTCLSEVSLTPGKVSLDRYEGNYPRFYKMDRLSRLAFLAAERLLAPLQPLTPRKTHPDAIVLFNHTSSIDSDRRHAWLVFRDSEGLASPSVFVYTLPNIAVGEIAIRHNCTGETALYILPSQDEQLINQIIQTTFQDKTVTTLLTGWVDYQKDDNFKCTLRLLTINPHNNARTH